MKKLIYTLSLLVAFSIAAQPTEYDPISFVSVNDEDLKTTTKVDVVELESNEFDFDTKKYLPKGFDAYKGMFLADNASIEEEATFDFNTRDYLPEGFDPYEGMFLADNASIEDEAFDFNTEDYLPLGFNPYVSIENFITAVEEDAEFDFDINDYLPKDFNAYTDFQVEGAWSFEICEVYLSI